MPVFPVLVWMALTEAAQDFSADRSVIRMIRIALFSVLVFTLPIQITTEINQMIWGSKSISPLSVGLEWAYMISVLLLSLRYFWLVFIAFRDCWRSQR